MESNFKAIHLTPSYIILLIDFQQPCVTVSVRVFSSLKETLPQQTFWVQLHNKWWLTIHCRWWSDFLSLDTECEISIKVNKGRVTIWGYCLLSKTYTPRLLMQAVAHSPPCLHLLLFSLNPSIARFSRTLSLSPFVAPPPPPFLLPLPAVEEEWLLNDCCG